MSRPTDEELGQFMGENQDETKLTRLVKEGGMNLMGLLLNKAMKPSSSEFKIPVHFRDIVHLPVQLQKAWKEACCKELEAL